MIEVILLIVSFLIDVLHMLVKLLVLLGSTLLEVWDRIFGGTARKPRL